ncbi:MAG: undecaprenyl-diphosphate phosphatase [Alphaproteobacteria bacterium]|nr:undecaprenyl-diphosphate phosphatase [Alphaproteobacteria bacterium]
MIDWHILLLSILQGLTEFLPVSSSGHLILFSIFTTFPDQGMALDIAVHVGSIFAVMIYFRKTIWQVIKGTLKNFFIPNFKDEGNKLFWLMVIGTLPVVFVGMLFRKYEIEFRGDDGSKIIGWTILVFGFLLFIADKIGWTVRKIEHLGIVDALLIGCAQCLALVPGTSRSGVTMTMARFLGMERSEAAKFSMLLSIPAIIGAATLVGYELYSEGQIAQLLQASDAVMYSFAASILAIGIMMWWLKKSTFLPFVIYRIVLGTILLLNAYGYIDILSK